MVQTDGFILGSAKNTGVLFNTDELSSGLKNDKNNEQESKHESNAQECINKLAEYLLGENYYIGDSLCNYQANEIITHDILIRHSIKYAKEQNRIKRDKKFKDGIRIFRIFGFEIILKR